MKMGHHCKDNTGIYKQFYASKFDCLDKMNKFIDRHTLPKQSQE